MISCAHCKISHDGFNYLHPLAVVCLTAQDGEPPYNAVKIMHSRAMGVSTLAVTPITQGEHRGSLSNELEGHHTANRTRELDTFLSFWCEHCRNITGVSFTFHKGSTEMNITKLSGSIDL